MARILRVLLLLMVESSVSVPFVGDSGHSEIVKNTERTVKNNLDSSDGKTIQTVLSSDSTPIPTSVIASPVFPSRLKEPKFSEPKFYFNPYAPVQPEETEYCRLPAKCQPLNYTTCLGSKLPYSKTTLELVNGLRSQEHAHEQLQVWRGLIHLPKCWAVIQPFLCALYMPKCDNDVVDLPSQEMCKMIMGPCRILAVDHGWPSVLRCDNTTKFQMGCKNDVREMKFNTTGKCKPPMVQTDYPSSFYDGMEGCGVQCDNPLFTPDERYQIHRFVAWTATISFLFNLFTVITFIIDWRSASKYPALVIFYINFCFMIVCIGWLAQFLPGGRDDIVCRKDGTLRVGEPSAGENLSCVVVFVLVYYFLMAGIVWFVILMYAWDISFQALGKIQERMDKKGAYFHLVAWSLPLILTITTMALGEIDGNSVVGICFVGYINHAYRIGLLLVPVLFAMCVGGYFLLKGLLTLIHLKISSQDVVSKRATAKIRDTIVRMGFFSLLIFVISITSFVCHIYEFRHSSSWKESFRQYIVCRLGLSETECRLETRPSLAILQLHILALFATGVTMSSWVWTSSTIDTWKRFLKRCTSKEPEGPVKIKKHKVIAQAFSKRKMLNSNGRLSISIRNTYQDPVGLEFELHSLNSGDLFSSFSSTWAAALPKLVTRRGALTGVTNSNSSQRRNSVDSEFSYSVRRVSVESRRHSLDSAVSVQVEELTGTLHSGAHRTRHKRRHREGRTRNRHRAAPLRTSSRHGSTTSQESQLGAQILSALTAIGNVEQPPVPSLVPNLNRRPGNAGLDGSLTVLAGKLFGNLTSPLNYNAPDHTPDSSGDEQVEEKQDSSTLPLEEKPLNSSSAAEEDSEGGGHMW